MSTEYGEDKSCPIQIDTWVGLYESRRSSINSFVQTLSMLLYTVFLTLLVVSIQQDAVAYAVVGAFVFIIGIFIVRGKNSKKFKAVDELMEKALKGEMTSDEALKHYLKNGLK